MNEVKSLEHYKWIAEETDKLEAMSKDWNGNFVSCCIPKRYEAYCKLLHPLYTDKLVIDKSIMWNSDNENEEFIQGGRISYKDLAKEYGLQYTKEISIKTIWRACGQKFSRYLSGAEEGNIDVDTCKRIIELLLPFTKNQQCYFYYYFLKTNDWTEDINTDGKLFKGNLEDVLRFYQYENVNGSPTYWWAEDKSWCVCTDYDLTFTLIGGTKAMIDSFLVDNFLECIEVNANTRIDYKADEQNLQ
ncbi:hypothetical protein [Aneurinibacillus uraniidurans]|uniref:hypothetical protein n=1 Tax=Aneurinibacillus uraniidurans TaxID=2966586 RepID=UPI002349CBBC|nr:hypothetical protein [Aneurinibacillus sp. B1]WCN39389.1 hypothetical protein PO771_08360 [Aneurinibacillus sp. B1]